MSDEQNRDSLGELAETLGETYIDGRAGEPMPPRIEIQYDEGPTGEPGGQSGEAEPIEVDCPHLRHQLATPAAWLPDQGHAILTWLLMPTALGLGRPVAALGQAEDGGPMLCCCPDLNVRQALDAGGLVVVPATEYDERAALALLDLAPGSPVDSNVILNEPGQPSVFVFGVSHTLRDALVAGATLQALGEVARDGDGDQA